MGSAIVDALIKQGICSAENLTIVEKVANPYVETFKKQGATIVKGVDELSHDLHLVILAVKPQDAEPVMKGLNSKTGANTLILSIMAGITINVLETILPKVQVIRCIPNTPCSIKMGMSVYCGNQGVTRESFGIAQQIFDSLGKAIRVDNEKMIDAATAISGTGPAYVFFLAEAMKQGAIDLGFNESEADTLATQTLLGAASLLDRSDDSPEELRRKVTSPGGTTEAAFKSYDKAKLKKILIDGYQAAFNRSLELGALK